MEEEGFVINELNSEGIKQKENFFLKNKNLIIGGAIILLFIIIIIIIIIISSSNSSSSPSSEENKSDDQPKKNAIGQIICEYYIPNSQETVLILGKEFKIN